MLNQLQKLHRRKQRIRTKLKKNTLGVLRLTVYRSNNHIYAQIIDDIQHKTLVSASSLEPSFKSDFKSGSNINAASKIGELIAKKAIAIGHNRIVFDRSGYLYHGRIKSLAESARAHGLIF